MKECKTTSDFESAIEHGKAINDVRPGQTAETTIRFLQNSREVIVKDEGSYKARDTKAAIKESVTQKVSRKIPYIKENPLLEQQGLIGNFVHESAQDITEQILSAIQDKSTNAAINYLSSLATYNQEGLKKIAKTYGKQFDATSTNNLFNGVKEMLLSVYKQQRAINTLTGKDGSVKIFTEQVMIDPRRNIGGTSDIIAIYSDNTAGIIDYKTKILGAWNSDYKGNIVDGSKMITAKAKKRYELQMGEYGRILREAYGVESVRSVFILPIKLNVKLNKGEYGNTITGLAFPGQDPLLEKVLPFSNKTGFKELDDYIRRVDERIAKLEARIKNDYKLRDELQPRIDSLVKGKTQLFLEHKLDSIIDFGKSLAKRVTDAELNKLTIEDLQELLEELNLVDTLTESTRNYRQYLKHTSKADEAEAFDKKIGEISTEIKDAIGTVKDVLFKDKVASLIETVSGFNVLDEYGNYIPFAQEGYAGKIFYQLSQYDNPVFKTLKKLLQEISYETRTKTDKVTEDIVNKEAALEGWKIKNGKSAEDIVSIFINPATDNFWGKYTKEYITEAQAANGSTLYKYYSPTERTLALYDERLAAAKDRFINEKLIGNDFEDAVDKWVSQNDLSLDSNNKPLYPEAWVNAKFYGRLQLIDNPSAYNEHYSYILSQPELKDYYEMFEHYNKEFRELLGVEYRNLPNNFLPNIRKSMMERVTEQGVNGLVEGTQDFFKDFSIREEDLSDDSTYNSTHKIPIFFLNPFRAEDGSLKIGEKSYQFGRSLQIFAKMAYNYEATTKREAHILALQQFLSSEAEQITQNRGKNMIDKMGNTLTEKLQVSDLPDIFSAFVDMYVYKMNVKSVIGDKSGKTERMLLKAKEYFTLKVLGFNVVAGAGSLVAAKINAMVEANKGVIYSKENYNESMKESWTDREKFLAINAFFDPMGHRLNNPRLSGETKYGESKYGDPTMKGWVNQYVNSRMLMNTFSVGDEYIEELITVAMSKHYYIDELGNVRRVKNDAHLELVKDRLIYNLFSYSKEDGAKLNLPEDQLMKAFEGFRLAIQAGQSRVKGTIPEEDKAYWQSTIFGQILMHFKSWMPGIMFERFGKIKFDDRIDSLYMGKYTSLHQEFRNPDKLAFKIYFQKILLPKMAKLAADIATFGLLSKSRLNDKINKQATFDQWLDENPHYKGKLTFEDFNEIQQKQLRSMIQELRVMLGLAALILLVGFDWDDDGEKDYNKYLVTRKLASLLFKVQQELSFVYSPVSFSSMVKSPIPMIGLVNDGWKTVSNTLDESMDLLFGEERLIGGQSKDTKPIGTETIKWIPGMSGIIRFFDILSNDVQYETNNF